MITGLVGTTGTGKTSIVDLLLGLIDPTDGRILIDGQQLSEGNKFVWQQGIGYVPQTVFLADASVAEKIAFGLAPAVVDLADVERAARTANIHQFFDGELVQGYATHMANVASASAARSGNASALHELYSIILLFSCSMKRQARSTMRPKQGLASISTLRHEMTIILVAHRASTLQACDRIIQVDAGRAILCRSVI